MISLSAQLRFVLMLLFSVSSSLPFTACTYAQTANQFNSWWYYAGTYKILPRTTIQAMYSWNRSDFIKHWQQSKLKIGAGIELNRHWRLAAGYEWVILYPYGEYPISATRTEHRVYEELRYDVVAGKLRISNGVRAEHRLVGSEWLHRIRLQTGAKLPVWRKDNRERLGVSLYDQVILNTDKLPLNQYLAQNRLYGGIDIYLSPSVSLGLGYMAHYIYLTKGRAEHNHTFICSLSHYLDMTRKRKPPGH